MYGEMIQKWIAEQEVILGEKYSQEAGVTVIFGHAGMNCFISSVQVGPMVWSSEVPTGVPAMIEVELPENTVLVPTIIGGSHRFVVEFKSAAVLLWNDYKQVMEESLK